MQKEVQREKKKHLDTHLFLHWPASPSQPCKTNENWHFSFACLTHSKAQETNLLKYHLQFLLYVFNLSSLYGRC